MALSFVVAHEVGHILYDPDQADTLTDEEVDATAEAVGRSNFPHKQIIGLMREFRADLFAVMMVEYIARTKSESEPAAPPFDTLLQRVYVDAGLLEQDEYHAPADIRSELLHTAYDQISKSR